MDLKRLNKIVNKAKKNYSKDNNVYDRFLDNKSQFIPFNQLLQSKYKMSFNETVSQILTQSQNQQSNLDNNTQNQLMQQQQKLIEESSFANSRMLNEQQPQISQMPSSSPVNVIGNGGSNTPINIVAKNYINPDSIEDLESVTEDVKTKKSRSLSKIPDKLLKSSATDWEPINYRGINESYHLHKSSSVEIQFDEKEQKVLYKVIEPELNKEEIKIIEDLKKAFVYVFEKISLNDLSTEKEELIATGTKKLALKYGIKLEEEQFKKINYYLERDFLGLGILEPIMYDKYIEDVSCDGLGVPIFVNHLKYGPLEVNRDFSNKEVLNSFIVKLAQKSNQEVSLSKPILQGALPDGSRVEAIYGKEISEKGSSFTIRKFRSEPFTPIHLMEFGTMPSFLLAYLWLAVENKQSILVSGGTATGKTTILNALSLFVPPTSKIVSIEDTPEINLPHEHWLPLISREHEGKAEVSMFDLLKASLRERPDYIVVGEIRGKEAAILFQGMATGHAGLGTFHADKFEDLINRMIIDPINLPKQLITELKICLFMKQMKVKENVVRRVSKVVEIVEYNARSDKFNTNNFLTYKPKEDLFEFQDKSATISHLIENRGGNEESLWQEVEKRRRILEFMHTNKILEFQDVSDTIKGYYKDPAGIFDYMENYSKKIQENEQKK